MADGDQLTTDQVNFCRAVEAMKLDLLRSGKEARWLVAHPGLLELVWGEGSAGNGRDGKLCGLEVLESSACPRGSFHVTHRQPGGGG